MNRVLYTFTAFSVFALPALASSPESGLNVGDRTPAFHPQHVSGPAKGTDTCPP
jgi:hypothetical protein